MIFSGVLFSLFTYSFKGALHGVDGQGWYYQGAMVGYRGVLESEGKCNGSIDSPDSIT